LLGKRRGGSVEAYGSTKLSVGYVSVLASLVSFANGERTVMMWGSAFISSSVGSSMSASRSCLINGQSM
jgi:hypothetical protein